MTTTIDDLTYGTDAERKITRRNWMQAAKNAIAELPEVVQGCIHYQVIDAGNMEDEKDDEDSLLIWLDPESPDSDPPYPGVIVSYDLARHAVYVSGPETGSSCEFAAYEDRTRPFKNRLKDILDEIYSSGATALLYPLPEEDDEED